MGDRADIVFFYICTYGRPPPPLYICSYGRPPAPLYMLPLLIRLYCSFFLCPFMFGFAKSFARFPQLTSLLFPCLCSVQNGLA